MSEDCITSVKVLFLWF